MANVVLFRPRETYSEAIATHRAPLGLIYLGTALKQKGFTVAIIDTETTPNWMPALQSVVDGDTFMAGVGVMTGYQIKGALEFSKAVRRIKAMPVVWGGLHPTLLPEQTIRNELVDVVVIGEGEAKFAALAKRAQERADLDAVPGIFFKDNGNIIRTHDESFLDMDSLATPDYSLVDIEYYANQKRRFMDGRARCLDLNTDRGCPNRCGFCYNLKFNDRRYRYMSAGKVIEAVSRLKELYCLDAINFTADNFFANKERVRSICAGLIERDLNVAWHADMRIDTFMRYDEELLRLVKQSGCAELTFGIESGSERVLALIEKDIHVKQALNAHDRSREIGFKVNYHFMIGFPEERRADVRETMKLICRLTRDRRATVFGPSMYIPYPGTPLFERSVQMGFKPPESLEGWITYDWDNISKFPWFKSSYRRYLNEAQYVAKTAIAPPLNFARLIFVKYFRLRLWGMANGISLFGLDIALLQFCKRGLRALGVFKHK